MKQIFREEEYILKKVIKDITSYWYVFFFFLIIFLGLAYLYNKYSAPTYNVGLKLLISTNEHNRNMQPEEFLQGFQLVRQSKDIENEMVIIQSLPLIEKTIKDLNFKVSYFYKENYVPYRYWPFYKYPNLILREMYGNVPFEIVPDEDHPQPVGVYFYIKILNNEEYSVSLNVKNVYLYNYKNNEYIEKKDLISMERTAKFGDTITGTDYSFRVLLNSQYNEEFDNKDLYFSFQDIYSLAYAYQYNLSVEQSLLDATVIDISFHGTNVQKSLDFLNALADNYIKRDLTKKSYIAETTIEYIDRELTNISASLNIAEGRLQNFKKKYQVMDIEQKNLQLSQYIQRLENQKNEILQNLRFYKELYKYFEENKDSPNMLAPSSMGVDDNILNNMIQQLATYNAEKNTLEEKNLRRNPRYKALSGKIEDLKNSISENIQFYIQSTQSRLDEINANIERYKFQESQLPQTQTQLLGYERKFNLSNDIYNFLLQKRAEAQIAKASIIPDSEIVENANYRGIASPKKKFNYIIAFFIAFLFPGTFFFAKTYFNNKVSDIEVVRHYSSFPVCGEILHNNTKTINILIDASSSPIAESFRTLRTNLNFLLKGKDKQTILVTSSVSLEGKTFTSFNLAVSLSLLQKKVIFLAFDLRKPDNLNKFFQNKTEYGLSEYLINNDPVQKYIQETDIDNFDVILPGPLPPNPTELIGSERTVQLFNELKKTYDYIVIDTPPIIPIADAFVLMKYTDYILFLVRQNYTNINLLKNNIEDFRQKGINNILLVLNDVKSPHKGKYYYYYKYPYNDKQKRGNILKIFNKSST